VSERAGLILCLAALALLAAAACGGSSHPTPTAVSPTSVTATPSSVPSTATPMPSPATPPRPFVGTLNGIPIDYTQPNLSGFDACLDTGVTIPPSVPEIESLVFGTGPMQVDPARLPPNTTRISPPEVFLCKGQVFSAYARFILARGTANANPGGGELDISRLSRFDYVRFPAPASSWSAASIGGLPAVTALVTNPTGAIQCFTAVVDPATGRATFVFASAAANRSLCETVAEALVVQSQ
jgi:hypothetical protein